MLFVLRQRDAKPYMEYWPGRCLLAALDAAAWPTLGIVTAMRLPAHGGLVGAVFVAACVVAIAHRLRRAIWWNHRYLFTTWRWGRGALVLIVFGLVLVWVVRA
jgi:hypothetical protein